MTVVASLCELTTSAAIDFWAGLQWPHVISPLQSKPQIQCESNYFYEIYIKFISQSRGKAHSAGWRRSCEWLVPPNNRAKSISTEPGLNIKEDTETLHHPGLATVSHGQFCSFWSLAHYAWAIYFWGRLYIKYDTPFLIVKMKLEQFTEIFDLYKVFFSQWAGGVAQQESSA